MRRVPCVVIVAIAAGASLLAACGGGSGGSATGTELELRQAARDLHVAFLEGDDDAAYRHYARRCTDRVSLAEYRAFARATRSLMELIAGSLDDFYVRDVLVRNVDGRSGEARAIVVIAGNPETTLDDLSWQQWEFTGARWLLTSCEVPGD